MAMAAELEPPRFAVEEAVRRALAEDLTPLGDLTSLLLPEDLHASAAFVARQPGVVAGRACVAETFRQVDERVSITWAVTDGDVLEAATTIATVEGPLPSILTAERTALNFLGHLSGIATLTRKYVAAAHGGGAARVWDTRKTTPGLRTLEKAAVRAGGGSNHRGNLSDWILLKDNHLALMGIGGAVEAARQRWPGRTVHVECDRIDQVEEALAAGADALLLDNMSFDEVRACVAAADAHAEKPGGRRPLLEVSGGVTLDTIGGYAATGIDLISVGAITNSAPVLDIGLDIA
jgi:nicotinate-nucleotide pyrophosphorylase (carboxylating)